MCVCVLLCVRMRLWLIAGADGYRQFTEAIRRAFHLPDDSELNITFTCDEPSTGWWGGWGVVCLQRRVCVGQRP